MSTLNYKCTRCNWIGKASLVEYEEVETCLGPENIEVCPNCGNSLLIFHQHTNPALDTKKNI